MKASESRKVKLSCGKEIEITALKVKKALQFAKFMDNDETGNIEKVEEAISYLVGKTCCKPVLQENEDSYFITVDDKTLDLVVSDLSSITEAMAIASFGDENVKKEVGEVK